jgi:hypothetical protein
VVVDAAEGTATSTPEDQLVLGPVAKEPDGGPPLALIGIGLFLVLVLGGIGLGAYAYQNRGPPLTDIRTWD